MYRPLTWRSIDWWQTRLRITWSQAAVIILIGVIGLYVLVPLALLFVNSFNSARVGQPPQYGFSTWADAFSEPGLLGALGNTFLVGGVNLAISFPIAVAVAWVLARTNIPGANAIEFMFWVSFFLPPLSVIMGWMLMLDPNIGVLNRFFVSTLGFDKGPFNIFSFWGIIWVHLMANSISIKVMLLTPAFRNMDATLEEAGRVSGASSFATFRKVTLPVMVPVLIVVFMFHVVRIFESFEIELLLGTPFEFFVYSTKIVGFIRQEPPLQSEATALGSITMLLLLIVIPVQRWLTTRRHYTTVTGRMHPAVADLGAWRWPAFGAVFFLAFLLLVVPLVAAVAGSFMTRFGYLTLGWTFNNWRNVLDDAVFLGTLKNTLIVAGTASIFGTFFFSIVAYVIARARARGRGLLDGLVWMPSVVPGILAGLGLFWMVLGTPFLNPLYGSLMLLVIAALMGGITLATQTMKASFLQIGNELEESARTSGAGWLRTYFRIVLPLLMPTMLLVATLKFLFAANATSSIVLLARADTRTLSLLTLDYVTEGLRESAIVTTVVITVLTTGLAVLVRSFGLRLTIRR